MRRRTGDRKMACLGFLLSLILSSCLLGSPSSVADESATSLNSLNDRHARITARFQAQIKKIVLQCRDDQDLLLADQLEDFYPKLGKHSLFFFLPSDDYLTSPVSSAATTFGELRRQHGKNLVQLARDAAAAGNVGLALSLIYEALYCDGDLAEAREILGHTKINGRWVSSETAKRLELGQRWSSAFGWLPKEDLERYAQGERRFRGKWISAQEDNRRHHQMRNGWKVETDHYEVTTNLSLRAGVELGQKLEAFYSIWSQLFAEYYLSPKDTQEKFSQIATQLQSKKKHKVFYFRNRTEYDSALARIEPGVSGKTLGVYLEKIKTAYFFAPAAENDAEKELSQITIWHEATHQLFAERIATRKVSNLKHNFWIVEGIACFMETLNQEAQGWRLGGPMAGRLPAARIRLEHDRFYIPMAEVVALGARAMLSNPQYRTLYTQAAGQAAFLMTGQNGRFRPSVIDYLRVIYRGRGTLSTLSSLTGSSLSALDQKYRDFLLQTSAE